MTGRQLYFRVALQVLLMQRCQTLVVRSAERASRTINLGNDTLTSKSVVT